MKLHPNSSLRCCFQFIQLDPSAVRCLTSTSPVSPGSRTHLEGRSFVTRGERTETPNMHTKADHPIAMIALLVLLGTKMELWMRMPPIHQRFSHACVLAPATCCTSVRAASFDKGISGARMSGGCGSNPCIIRPHCCTCCTIHHT